MFNIVNYSLYNNIVKSFAIYEVILNQNTLVLHYESWLRFVKTKIIIHVLFSTL